MHFSRYPRHVALVFVLLCLSLSPALAIQTPKQESPPVEMRGMWVVRDSMTSPQSIRATVEAAAQHNFNTLFVQVRGRGDAWYRSELEPRAEALRKQPSDFDPLATAIAEGHKHGLKVHAWLNTYLVWSAKRGPASSLHIVNAHPDWLARDRNNKAVTSATGGMEGAFLQPAKPEVQEHLYRVFLDVVKRYDVDGIHFDYVRYPNEGYDFSDDALKRFKEWMSPRVTDVGMRAVKADGTRLAWVHTFSTDWAEWRRQQVTGLVARISNAVHKIKPWVVVSAAVFADPEDAYKFRGQDWRGWLASGYLDAVVPMAYSLDTNRVVRLISMAVASANGKHVYAGLGSWRISSEDTAEKIARIRELGCQGFNLFSYDGMTSEGRRMDYLDNLTRRSLTSRAATPRMKWREERAGDKQK